LPGRPITKNAQRLDQSWPVNVARQLHAASISSRTKCRRIPYRDRPQPGSGCKPIGKGSLTCSREVNAEPKLWFVAHSSIALAVCAKEARFAGSGLAEKGQACRWQSGLTSGGKACLYSGNALAHSRYRPSEWEIIFHFNRNSLRIAAERSS
jgi:hypothetical protein